MQSGEEEAYRLDEDPGELVSRPDDVPGELRERLYAELETVSRHRSAPRRRRSSSSGCRTWAICESEYRLASRGRQQPQTLSEDQAVTDLARLYGRMVLIRRFEESLLELFSLGKLAGTTHTYIGQEANAVGVIDHLERGRDVIVSNHRCHGHYLAFTDDVDGLLGEVMGKASGVCGGKGGSQHLCNDGFYSNGVLGSTMPVATGMALAERERGCGAVTTVAFIGDGTLGQGVVYESLNIASRWGLPLLVVVENNYYAQSTPSHLTLAGRDRRPRRRLRHRDGRAGHDRRGRDLGCGRRDRAEGAVERAAVLPRAQHVSLQPALEGRRQPRPGGDRGGAAARSARRRRLAARRGERASIEEACERR